MKSFTTLVFLAYGASVAIAASCNADNCARAVTGTQRGLIAQSSAKNDCSNFMKATVYPATVTSTLLVTVIPTTATATPVSTVATTIRTVVGDTTTIVASTETRIETVATITVNRKRAAASLQTTGTVKPTAIPIYASACTGTARYISACSCFGATRMTTVTMPTPTFIETVIVSATAYTAILSLVTHTSIVSLTVQKTVTTTTTAQSTATATAVENAYCANGNSVNGLSPVCQIGPCSSFNLRIEGATDTIYEGRIYTGPEQITTPSSQEPHLCNGQGGTSDFPSGTATTGIRDAGELCGFDFDGTYNPTYNDFFITRIASTAQDLTNGKYWGLLNNFANTATGGCGTQPQSGDEILWAFDSFAALGFLDVQPRTLNMKLGDVSVVTVKSSGGSGSPQSPTAGALFGNGITDANGQVAYVANQVGTFRLKATRNSYIRSPAVIINVTA